MPGQETPSRSNRKVAHGCQAVGRVAKTGFTLVEMVVAAMMSSMLAGVLLVILTMNNHGVKDGAVNAQVQSQYETSIAEIAAHARRASAVLAGSETFPPAVGMTPVLASKIEMYFQDAGGTVTKIRGFWVNEGILKEWKPGWSDYRPFIVGSWPALSVTDATPFHLSSNRKTVTVSMRVRGVFSGDSAIAPARGETFTCRN